MPLIATILAQVLTASVGDRIESRVLVEPDDERIEAENLAFATSSLEFSWLTLRATYAPSVLLTPVERSPRDLSVTHTLVGSADLATQFYESRRVTASFHVGGAYVQQNLRYQRLGAPLPTAPSGAAPDPMVPPSSPDTTSEGAVPAESVTTRTASSRADVAMSERVTARSTFGQYVGYNVSSGLDDTSRIVYPLTHGPDAGLSFLHVLSHRDTLTTSATAQMTFIPSTDERATSVGVSQSILHLFSRRTSGDASAGVAYVRVQSPEEGRVDAVVPTAALGLTHDATAAGGELRLRAQIAYGPVLDRSTLAFDKRFDAQAGVTWTRRKWRLYATTATVLSVNPSEEGSLRSVAGTAGADYEIGSGFTAHAGARTLWETFQGLEVVPTTWVGFVALSWSADLL